MANCSFNGKDCRVTPSLRISFFARRSGRRDFEAHRLVCGRCFGKAMTAAKRWSLSRDADGALSLRTVQFKGIIVPLKGIISAIARAV